MGAYGYMSRLKGGYGSVAIKLMLTTSLDQLVSVCTI